MISSPEYIVNIHINGQVIVWDGLFGEGKALGNNLKQTSFVLTAPTQHFQLCETNRLVGLVVKASASRAEGPRFESR